MIGFKTSARKKALAALLGAALFYCCGGVFFFREAVFTERVPICTDILLNTYPWALARPPGFTPSNQALSDHCTVFYPLYFHNAKHLGRGEIPMWTPYVLGGAPYQGGLGVALWYPLNLLVGVIPLNTWFTVQSLVKFLCAGLFTYLFLRKVGLGYFCAFFGGAMYAFGGFNVLWVIAHLTSVAVILPALLWATEVFLDRRTALALVPIPVLLAIQFLGAMPEISVCLALAWMIYLVFRIRARIGLFGKDGVRSLALAGAGGLLSIGLVCFQLIPFLEYMVRSFGYQIRKRAAEARYLFGGTDPLFTGEGILAAALFLAALAAAFVLFRRGRKPASALAAGIGAGVMLWIAFKAALVLELKPHFLIQFFPDLYGNPLDRAPTRGGMAYPEFNGGYGGILPLLLAAAAMVRCWRRSPVGIFTALFLLAFGGVHGIPFIYQLIKAIPIVDMVPPGRMVAISAFSIAALSAFGLDHLLRISSRLWERLPALMRGAGAAAVGGFFIAALGLGNLTVPFLDRLGDPPPVAGEPDEEGVVIETPRPSAVIHGDEGLFVEGRAGQGVDRIRFYLNGKGIGDIALDGAEGADRSFRFSFPLDRILGGSSKLGVHLLTAAGGEEGPFLTIPVDIAHRKEFRPKDLAVAAGSLAAFLLIALLRRFNAARAALALTVACIDFALFGADYNVTSDPATIFPDTAVTDFLTEHNGPFRILPENVILQPSTPYLYEYSVIRGYDGLELPEYNELLNWMKKDPWVDPHHYNSETIDYESNLLDLLGVKYIVSLEELGGIEGLKKVFDGPVKIFENLEAYPKAFIAPSWRSYEKSRKLIQGDPLTAYRELEKDLTEPPEDPAEALSSPERFTDYVKKRFDYRNCALLEEEIELDGGGAGEVKLLDYQEEYILLECILQGGGGVLVLADNYFPGWEALVDGEGRKILRTQVTFRGLPLEEGRHRVEFRYRPASFRIGLLISAASALALLLAAAVSLLLSARRNAGGVGDNY